VNTYSPSWRYSQGTTLLEVLIAAVILGIGLLGIAALQITSLQGSANAEYRGRASDQAWSLMDRMRANLPGIVSSNYLSSTTADCDNPPTACAMTPGTTAAIGTCSSTQVAAWDLWEVRCSNGVQDALPGGTMLVTSTTSSTYQIEINWLTRTDDDSDDEAYSDKMTVNFMPWTDPTL
jgi:type IV pilus assembly protein PilV